jgi:hypothetical protein
MSDDNPKMNEADLKVAGARNTPPIPTANIPKKAQLKTRLNGLRLITA